LAHMMNKVFPKKTGRDHLATELTSLLYTKEAKREPKTSIIVEVHASCWTQ